MRHWSLCVGFLLAAATATLADTVQLKSESSVDGRILAEKKDSVALDIGYTVLVIPRDQIQ